MKEAKNAPFYAVAGKRYSFASIFTPFLYTKDQTETPFFEYLAFLWKWILLRNMRFAYTTVWARYSDAYVAFFATAANNNACLFVVNHESRCCGYKISVNRKIIEEIFISQ